MIDQKTSQDANTLTACVNTTSYVHASVTGYGTHFITGCNAANVEQSFMEDVFGTEAVETEQQIVENVT